MKRYIQQSDAIFAMSNVQGNRTKVPGPLSFSFYFSIDDGNSHGPRVKVVFDSSKVRASKFGTQRICDNWEFIPGADDKNVSTRSIAYMQKFMRRYLVLFLAAWDEIVVPDEVRDYFLGRISFDELLEFFDFYEEYADELRQIHTVDEFETFCRVNNLVNFYGN